MMHLSLPRQLHFIGLLLCLAILLFTFATPAVSGSLPESPLALPAVAEDSLPRSSFSKAPRRDLLRLIPDAMKRSSPFRAHFRSPSTRFRHMGRSRPAFMVCRECCYSNLTVYSFKLVHSSRGGDDTREGREGEGDGEEFLRNPDDVPVWQREDDTLAEDDDSERSAVNSSISDGSSSHRRIVVRQMGSHRRHSVFTQHLRSPELPASFADEFGAAPFVDGTLHLVSLFHSNPLAMFYATANLICSWEVEHISHTRRLVLGMLELHDKLPSGVKTLWARLTTSGALPLPLWEHPGDLLCFKRIILGSCDDAETFGDLTFDVRNWDRMAYAPVTQLLRRTVDKITTRLNLRNIRAQRLNAVFIRRPENSRRGRVLLNFGEVQDAVTNQTGCAHSAAYDFSGVPLLNVTLLMRRAALVVAAHGAGLANIIFCDPRAVLLEFHPPRQKWVYENLARAIGMAYYPFIVSRSLAEETEDSAKHRRQSFDFWRERNLRIDVPLLSSSVLWKVRASLNSRFGSTGA
eukprot:NODE_1208_length_1641_cov_25.251256_g1073_i0.p1 GENE.NODE_1208_length_1641_cov_25.251256_g1073_i0~~NODE_1208_length_1641_cov_25.251256_g1073_i0.p1  ORF type:complete len:519 (+),score=63.47 NODE_1208_length_1641_cov_25.251256_g1073_i0:67-1623(+)